MKKEPLTIEETDHVYELLSSGQLGNIRLAHQLSTYRHMEWDYKRFMDCFPNHDINYESVEKNDPIKFNFKFNRPVLFNHPLKSKTTYNSATLEVSHRNTGGLIITHSTKKTPIVFFENIYVEKDYSFDIVSFDSVVESCTPIWDTVYIDWHKRVNDMLNLVHHNLEYFIKFYTKIADMSIEVLQTQATMLPNPKDLIKIKNEIGEASGHLKKILDNKEYFNIKFGSHSVYEIECGNNTNDEYIARIIKTYHKKKEIWRDSYAILNEHIALKMKTERLK